MNPNRVDFLVDLAYGVVIRLSVGLILVVGTGGGVAPAVGDGAVILRVLGVLGSVSCQVRA